MLIPESVVSDEVFVGPLEGSKSKSSGFAFVTDVYPLTNSWSFSSLAVRSFVGDPNYGNSRAYWCDFGSKPITLVNLVGEVCS